MSSVPPELPPDDASFPEVASVPLHPTTARKKRLILLAGALMCLVGTGAYFKWSAVRAESNTSSVRAALAANGITIIETNEAPDDSLSPFQSWDTPKVVRIQSGANQVTDAELAKIALISQHLNLMLASCPITNDGLSNLEGKSNVRYLNLAKTSVTDEGMKHLRGMNLQSLDLSATRITDAGLATLGEFDFPDLKEIVLIRTPITDEGLMHLASFKALEWVSTRGTKVTRDGIRKFKVKRPEAGVLD
jgi:hypothetical protein